jgi:hypothetical protein
MQIELQPGVVAGNSLQALVTMHLQVPANKVKLWQPLTLLPKGKPRELYDLAVMFEPTIQPDDNKAIPNPSTCGLPPVKSRQHGTAPGQDANSAPASSDSIRDAGGGDVPDDSTSSDSSSGSGAASYSKAPVPELRSTIVRRIGFRTVELVQEPIATAARELLRQQPQPQPQPQVQTQPQQAPLGAPAATAATAGESFYFRVNGVPVFAKGANLIPLHVLSTAVSEGRVRALLQSAVDANMNMIRIWGGGRYQVSVGPIGLLIHAMYLQ